MRMRLQQPAASAAPTQDEVRRRYGPARSLGAPQDAVAAMDAALVNGGFYGLLQHTLEMGQMPLPQFLGYGALQAISQDGLIRACVSTVADDMTRNWIDIQRRGAADEAVDAEVVTDLSTMAERLELQKVFHEAVELAGYEGGALVFVDTGEENLSLPLNVTANSRELRPGARIRFTAIDPVNCFPGNYNGVDPLRPDYYRPTTWWVMGRQVHASRLLRIVENEVPILLKPSFNFFGIPQAQILWDYVIHFQECRVAVARLLTKFSLTVFKTQLLDGQGVLGMPQASNLDQRVQFMVRNMNNDGVLAVDKNEEDVVKVETSMAGCVDIVRQALEFLAAVNRTPAVKLLGISPSGFNATGESDLRNYYDHVAALQKKMLRDAVKTALDCVQLVTFGRIDPDVTFEFRPLSEEDKSLAAQLRKTSADTMAVLLDRDVISVEEARKRLADDPDSGFSDIDPDDAPEGNSMPDLPTQEDLVDTLPSPLPGNPMRPRPPKTPAEPAEPMKPDTPATPAEPQEVRHG